MNHDHARAAVGAATMAQVETEDGTATAASGPAPLAAARTEPVAPVEAPTNALSGPITVPGRVRLADTGFDAHPLALGGSVFGWTLGADESEAVLDRFAALGGTVVDTADSYASGRSESIVGRWMASRRTRDRMVLTTKVGRLPERRGLAPETLRAAVDESLARLRTDTVDVLYLHGEDPAVPLEESLGAVGALMQAGKVRALGASDFSPERLIEARVLAANGLPRIQLVTTRYNLMDRRPFEGAPELVAHAQGLGVLPYFALANGFLGGGVRRRSDVRHDARGARLAQHLGRRGHRVLAALDALAFARDVPPATIAIAWLLSRPTVVAPVAGATRPEQVDALLAAASVQLHRSELVELDRASA